MTRDLSVGPGPSIHPLGARITRFFARPQANRRRRTRKGALYGVFFFLTSTLLPMTPPRIPPAAAPMIPPFNLSRLVVAPMTAPAAAPIAASRFVFFCTVVRGAGAGVVEPTLEPPEVPPDDDRRAVPPLLEERVAVRAGAAAPRSTAEMLSSERAEFA